MVVCAPRIKRSAYDITDKIPVTVLIRNDSSSEVTGCTVKVRGCGVGGALGCTVKVRVWEGL